MSIIWRAIDLALNGLGDFGFGPRADERMVLAAMRSPKPVMQDRLWDLWKNKPDIVIGVICRRMIANPFSEDFLCAEVRDKIIGWLQKASYQKKAEQIKNVFGAMYFSRQEKADRDRIINEDRHRGIGLEDMTRKEFNDLAEQTKGPQEKLDQMVMVFAQTILNVLSSPKQRGDLLENGCEALALAVGGEPGNQMNFLYKNAIFTKVVGKIQGVLQILIRHPLCSVDLREHLGLISRVLEHTELQQRINNIIHRPGETGR